MSKLPVLLILASLAMAAPAADDGYGTFAPNRVKSGGLGEPASKPRSSFVGGALPSTTAPTSPTRRSGMMSPPEASTPAAIKPYERWKPSTTTTSMFGPDGRPKR